MVLWLRKIKKVTPAAAPQCRKPVQPSLRRRLGRAVGTTLKNTFQSKAFARLALLSVLALGALSCYAIVDWWDRKFPKPPLGIISGELLKGFERYSPHDRHVEQVLTEIMSAEVPKTEPCGTPACQWVETETVYDAQSEGRPEACEDFYEHVCWKFEGPSLYERASRDLMVQVADHLTSMMDSSSSDVSEDVSMLRQCIDGASEAAYFALDCDFGVRKSTDSAECPLRYPSLPLKAVEQLFDDPSAINVKDFLSIVSRYGEEYNVVVRLELGKWEVRQAVTAERANSFCDWVGEAARCHLQERFDVSEDDVRLYQKLWNELYFAPLFLGYNVSSSLWDLFDEDGDTACKMACVEIHEGLFQPDSAQAAVVVLNERLKDVHQVVSDLFHATVHVLSMRVPTWLSRHAEGENPQFQHQRKPGYLAELQSVSVELVGMLDDATADYGTSVYSSVARYDYGRNALIVPQGLVALMAKITDVVDPLSSVFVFTQLIRPLLPQYSAPYSWKFVHDHHLAYVTGCLRSVYNASLDFDNSPGLLLAFAYESALLGPLYDVYHRGVHEGVSAQVYLNHNYTNWQLFFVLWAMSHCGTEQGTVMVNAAVRNSMRFGRVFQCSNGDQMFSSRKCNFWVYW